jgi:outer membrane receptor protein involved in Fe transport
MGDEGNVDRKVGGFARFDLGAAVKLGRGLSAYLDVTNIFNRHHATFGAYSETDEIDLAEVPGASDPRANSPAAPRRILLGLRWRR